ncbi:uncharacterized protein LOC130301098 isoform X2 [Hyla sarda]|nr:uncharacterized protein LOC130301098 isoform X2 [Hyla sarda]XP_056407565.1 uncharacterized protein LOC130301098 isoform X2 [Hyla sarda]XP_056407566.1 uncharacterized protein LOC130301098 isoform X2 [Hyla sarda]
MTCPVCCRPHKSLSTHLKRKCMRLNSEGARKAALESAKKTLVSIASKGTTISYEEIMSLGSLENVVPFLEDRGFIIPDKPTSNRNIRHKRTSTSVSAATSTLQAAASQVQPLHMEDDGDTLQTQEDLEVAHGNVKPEEKIEDMSAKTKNNYIEETAIHPERDHKVTPHGSPVMESVPKIHNRTPMTCPVCYRPHKVLSTHLKRKCMRLNSEGARKAALESAKKTLVSIASKGTTISYEEIMSLGSLENVVPFLEDRGFIIPDKPTSNRNIRHKRTSTFVSAATSTLQVAASQVQTLHREDDGDTLQTQDDLEVKHGNVENKEEIEDMSAETKDNYIEETDSHPERDHKVTPHGSPVMESVPKIRSILIHHSLSICNSLLDVTSARCSLLSLNSHNRTPMTCPVCYRPHKVLSTHLKRKCMRLNSEEARKATLESAKKTLVNIASKGTTISYEEIMSLGSLENVVPFLEDRGFIIPDKPTSNRNIRHKRTSTSVSAATSTLQVAASQVQPLCMEDDGDTLQTQDDLKVAHGNVENKEEIKDVSAETDDKRQQSRRRR